jgi:hypothetical protein
MAVSVMVLSVVERRIRGRPPPPPPPPPPLPPPKPEVLASPPKSMALALAGVALGVALLLQRRLRRRRGAPPPEAGGEPAAGADEVRARSCRRVAPRLALTPPPRAAQPPVALAAEGAAPSRKAHKVRATRRRGARRTLRNLKSSHGAWPTHRPPRGRYGRRLPRRR